MENMETGIKVRMEDGHVLEGATAKEVVEKMAKGYGYFTTLENYLKDVARRCRVYDEGHDLHHQNVRTTSYSLFLLDLERVGMLTIIDAGNLAGEDNEKIAELRETLLDAFVEEVDLDDPDQKDGEALAIVIDKLRKEREQNLTAALIDVNEFFKELSIMLYGEPRGYTKTEYRFIGKFIQEVAQ